MTKDVLKSGVNNFVELVDINSKTYFGWLVKGVEGKANTYSILPDNHHEKIITFKPKEVKSVAFIDKGTIYH